MAEGGVTIVNYEVYVLNGTRWELHQRYRREQREIAIEEGKQIEKNLGRGVKVVRDTYSPSSNENEEAVVYISDDAIIRNPRKPTAAAGGAKKGSSFFDDDEDDVRPSAAVAGRGGVTASAARARADSDALGPMFKKLVTVFGTSAVVAGVVTAIMSQLFTQVPSFQSMMSPDTQQTISFFIFVATFLLLAVPMTMNRIDWSAPKAAGRPVRLPPPKLKPKPVELPPEEEKKEEEAKEEEKPEEEKKEEEQPAEEGAPNEANVESGRKAMLGYLGVLLSQVKKAMASLDSYNVFGINLMLAGAVDVLADKQNLSPEEKQLILQKAMEGMGTKPETAKTFASKAGDYLVEPRYLAMVQAGRSTMNNYLETQQVPSIAGVLDNWSKPQAAQAQAQIVTVMFTDMVGSTDMTERMGDKGAQEVVRRHNSIVRAVLSQYQGKEIKHTGDGIMASFNSAANGVEAAVSIQKLIAAHNQRHGDLELHVRIGVNAGEPIQEEDDLFGSTVQIAARVCAFAAKDQIIVTNVVRELASSNKSIGFVDKGGHTVKGIKERMQMYEVPWSAPDLSRAKAS